MEEKAKDLAFLAGISWKDAYFHLKIAQERIGSSSVSVLDDLEAIAENDKKHVKIIEFMMHHKMLVINEDECPGAQNKCPGHVPNVPDICSVAKGGDVGRCPAPIGFCARQKLRLATEHMTRRAYDAYRKRQKRAQTGAIYRTEHAYNIYIYNTILKTSIIQASDISLIPTLGGIRDLSLDEVVKMTPGTEELFKSGFTAEQVVYIKERLEALGGASALRSEICILLRVVVEAVKYERMPKDRAGEMTKNAIVRLIQADIKRRAQEKTREGDD